MFHICQKGKLKVWCNQNIYKNVPEQYNLGEGPEEDMVMKIISIIDRNTDQSSKHFSIKNVLMREPRLSFASVIVMFRKICRDNRFTISEYIESLQNSAQIESLLDIYIPQNSKNMKPSETGMTFNPSKHKKSSPNLNTTQDITNRRRSSASSSKRGYRIFPP